MNALDRLVPAREAIAEQYPLVDAQDAGPHALAAFRQRLVDLFADLGVADAAGRIALPADCETLLGLAGGANTHEADSFTDFLVSLR
ncbi:hypothetical protein GCM10010399_89490 [Dactylosporangium fulvum]|uniref:Uncharacterized protein n=1 Tax=Dactylosporangium fulvum TaxID=53359 RepID=A0ABY5WE19_9ACTN|nr:hypothetical protein [Dactylosporangium fulvum]UWP86996.1 hypothetical protein Dfulv_23245 [Dactylosporangium fulvum]